MRKLLLMGMACAVSVCFAANAWAAIGWAGNVYPNNGALVVPTGPVTVYAQVWKEGTTDSAGQGAGVTADLIYTTNIAASITLAMTYNVDVGSNDEYKADIPQAALAGAAYVDVTVVFHDLTDGTSFEMLGDQQGHAPPLRYTVTNVLPAAVAVTFTLCMSGTTTNAPPCVIGSAPELGVWGTGVTMTNVSGELWMTTVTFAAGSSPAFEYKYKKDDCTDWEFVGNRFVTLPTDGTINVTLAPDSYNNAPLGCDLGRTLQAEKIICFQACLEGVPTNGVVCVIGSAPELTVWTTGVPMVLVGINLWEACVHFLPGQPVPATIEYKFKKDDCNTWESVGNRSVVLDDSSPDTQTLLSTWDNGTTMCSPVPNGDKSWGSIKSRFGAH